MYLQMVRVTVFFFHQAKGDGHVLDLRNNQCHLAVQLKGANPLIPPPTQQSLLKTDGKEINYS